MSRDAPMVVVFADCKISSSGPRTASLRSAAQSFGALGSFMAEYNNSRSIEGLKMRDRLLGSQSQTVFDSIFVI